MAAVALGVALGCVVGAGGIAGVGDGGSIAVGMLRGGFAMGARVDVESASVGVGESGGGITATAGVDMGPKGDPASRSQPASPVNTSAAKAIRDTRKHKFITRYAPDLTKSKKADSNLGYGRHCNEGYGSTRQSARFG